MRVHAELYVALRVQLLLYRVYAGCKTIAQLTYPPRFNLSVRRPNRVRGVKRARIPLPSDSRS